MQGYGPDSAFDYMGYCDPSWVSDYRWRKAYEQIRILTSWDYESSVDVPAPERHLLQGLIYEDGTQEWWTTLGAPTPGREFVDSSVDLQVEGGGALRLDAKVWEVQDAGQQKRKPKRGVSGHKGTDAVVAAVLRISRRSCGGRGGQSCKSQAWWRTRRSFA